jgi:methylase of polypeptide subunit release factors
VSPNTFAPSTITLLLADAMDLNEGDVVVDVGTGCGILAIIAAKLGASRVIAVDNGPDVEAVGRANAVSQRVEDKITFLRGDLFDPVPDDIEADVIIGDVSGIPDELAAISGWFPNKTGGGPRGSELPIRMLEEAKRLLRPGGRLFLPTGSLQDVGAVLRAARSLYDRLVEIASRMIPLPGTLAESPVVRKLVDAGVVSLTPRGSRFLWEAKVWELEPGSA